MCPLLLLLLVTKDGRNVVASWRDINEYFEVRTWSLLVAQAPETSCRKTNPIQHMCLCVCECVCVWTLALAEAAATIKLCGLDHNHKFICSDKNIHRPLHTTHTHTHRHPYTQSQPAPFSNIKGGERNREYGAFRRAILLSRKKSFKWLFCARFRCAPFVRWLRSNVVLYA